jgi:hypothetical protein
MGLSLTSEGNTGTATQENLNFFFELGCSFRIHKSSPTGSYFGPDKSN